MIFHSRCGWEGPQFLSRKQNTLPVFTPTLVSSFLPFVLEANQQSEIHQTSSLPSPKRCSKKVWQLWCHSFVQTFTVVMLVLLLVFISLLVFAATKKPKHVCPFYVLRTTQTKLVVTSIRCTPWRCTFTSSETIRLEENGRPSVSVLLPLTGTGKGKIATTKSR